jgi:hypothetical protein
MDEWVVGVLLESANAFRLLDRGPASDDTDAVADFVEFWGDKAEVSKRKAVVWTIVEWYCTVLQMRRFADGSIVHAVLWGDPEESATQRWNIPHRCAALHPSVSFYFVLRWSST